MKSSRVVAVSLVVFCMCSPFEAIAGAWLVSGGAGAAGSYDAVKGAYRETFGPTWQITWSARRPLSSSLDLRAASGWIRHSRDVGLASSDGPPPIENQRVNLIPISLGLRWNLPMRSSSSDHPFIDVAPALVWSRSWQRFREVGYDLNGTYHHEDVIVTRSQFRPGIEGGLGMAFRGSRHIHPEFGLHFLASAAPDGAPLFYDRSMQTLKQWTAGVSLGWER